MAQIFISYRRSDSTTISGRIYDRLRQEFGKGAIFKDVDNIPAGRDFRGVLREATADCGVMLVIIGPGWVNAVDAAGNRRLDDPSDFVRLEVETGLQRDDVRVIPVIVSHASPPRASDLPENLQELAYKNAIFVRDDPDFHRDIDRLIEELKTPIRRTGALTRPRIDWRWFVAAILIPLIAALIAVTPALIEVFQNINVTELSPTDVSFPEKPTTLPNFYHEQVLTTNFDVEEIISPGGIGFRSGSYTGYNEFKEFINSQGRTVYYAVTQISTSKVWADWYVKDMKAGFYEISTYISQPYATTHNAQFHIRGVRNVSSEIVIEIDQSLYRDDWVILGVFEFDESPYAGRVTMNDVTGENNRSITFDAIRYRRVNVSN